MIYHKATYSLHLLTVSIQFAVGCPHIDYRVLSKCLDGVNQSSSYAHCGPS